MLVASIKEAKFKDAEPVWSPASLFLALFEDGVPAIGRLA